jgi:KaiC/GvpD/RAD55 family RecA-like ATPase
MDLHILSIRVTVIDTKDNIQDIPASGRAKRRTTGIVGLNLLLDGGFPEGTLIMLYGTPVAGVDLAAYQFWKAGEQEEGTYLMNDGDVDAGMIDATEMHPDLYPARMAGNRIVIDSLTILILKYGIEVALKLLRSARDEIRKRNANIVFVVYSGIHQPIDIARIMKAADIVIEFGTEIRQNDIGRTLVVQKVRGAAAPQRLLPFIITERGIEASTTSRVV